MKYDYKFDEMVLKSGKKTLIIQVEKPIDLVSDFLMFDVQGADVSFYLDILDKVLSGENAQDSFTGNGCSVNVYPNITRITDMYSEDEEYSEIETTELRGFIVLWANKFKEYYHNK